MSKYVIIKTEAKAKSYVWNHNIRLREFPVGKYIRKKVRVKLKNYAQTKFSMHPQTTINLMLFFAKKYQSYTLTEPTTKQPRRTIIQSIFVSNAIN